MCNLFRGLLFSLPTLLLNEQEIPLLGPRPTPISTITV
ncbi:hypothetical protein GLYMA_19G101550v4 [Glycine max]|nr:hypothetical protein GLYMA_19G101550v4 [Glycine max]KAH1077172.1 hypothetical protein GYH30_052612 [Glycine max]